MSVHIGLHKTLFKMGKWRFGIGYRMKGTTGLIMLFVYGMMNYDISVFLVGVWGYLAIFCFTNKMYR